MNNIINKLIRLHVTTEKQKNNILKELINRGIKPNKEILKWIDETVKIEISHQIPNTQTKRPRVKRRRGINTSNITKQMECTSINNRGGKKQKK